MATNTVRLHRVIRSTPERIYRAFLDAEVKKISGKAPEKKKTFAERKAAYEKNPKDADAAAEFALASLERSDRIEARKEIGRAHV